MTPEERVLLFDTDQYIYPHYGVTPVRITERGWGGHYCMAQHCLFRRNTLLEYGDKKFIVSTVGNMRRPPTYDLPEEIGLSRYYETMSFVDCFDGIYWDADVAKQLHFDSQWQIAIIDDAQLNRTSDAQANIMHDIVVAELADVIQTDDVPLME